MARRVGRARAVGLLFLVLVVLLQPWGMVAADTKHDLVANPRGFLSGALHAYTDVFTLGQLQNQAYGYLFPQGLFFLLTNPLPDWIAQRLWWWLVLAVGYCGFFALARTRVSAPAAAGAGLLYALSPRVLSTLGAISSETWPVMLAPWVLLPFLRERLSWRSAAPAVLAVGMMGAVNATATLAACVPAAIVLLYRRAWLPGLAFAAGSLCVSAWWIVPLIILGRYAPPFTEFIESSYVTTRWLNLPEILRGTTSWAPFVDTERVAGHALVSEPVFVLLTMAVAALGLAGLVRLPRVWRVMALVGVAILGTHAAWYLDALDGPLAALRNLHKFDPVLRIPLTLGVAVLLERVRLPRSSHLRPRQALGVLAVLVVAGSLSPAWSGRLLPKGAYEEVPHYWQEAADFLNTHAAGTRTLIFPEASFARQDWGWTRDEPAQPLLEVPWAVRDAIPLVPPEAIRGLDGVMALLHEEPQAASAALQRLGIGAVLLRHDLAADPELPAAADFLPDAANPDLQPEVHTFGEVDVILLDPQRSMALSSPTPQRVAGGGESLALLDALNGPAARQLVTENAEVVTDTPTLSDRNYGTLRGALSAPLAPGDPSTVNNRLRDYPSAGPPSQVISHGGTVRASSSAADADAFGGAKTTQSVTAAVDGENSTSWWPAPGDTGWIELRPEDTADPAWQSPRLNLMATSATEVIVHNGSASVKVSLKPYRSRQVRVPGGSATAIRVELTHRTGLANVEVAGAPIERILRVPDTSPGVRQFVFSQLQQDARVLRREFSAPREMQVRVGGTKPVLVDSHAHQPGETLTLSAGTHTLRTTGAWASLTDTTWQPAARYQTLRSGDGHVRIEPAPEARLLITGRAANPGLRAQLLDPDGAGAQELTPMLVDASTQAFRIPAGASGELRMSFAAERLYRAGLGLGGALAALSVGLCLLVLARDRRGARPSAWRPAEAGPAALFLPVVGAACLGLAGGVPALAGGALVWAALRWTTLHADYLAAALAAAAEAMLARAPWPAAHYAGDSWLLAALCGAALACLCLPEGRHGRSARRAGFSTSA